MLIPENLEEIHSTEDSSGRYCGIWFKDMPEDPMECYKYYLCIEDKPTGRRILIPAKESYLGKNHPHFSLRRLEFRDDGLVAEVQEIVDVTGDQRLVHLSQNQRFRDVSIRIPRSEFPK